MALAAMLTSGEIVVVKHVWAFGLTLDPDYRKSDQGVTKQEVIYANRLDGSQDPLLLLLDVLVIIRFLLLLRCLVWPRQLKYLRVHLF